MSKFSSRIFGIYLVIISTLQMTLYGYLFFGNLADKDSLKYQVLDPRIFWSVFELGSESTSLNYIGWLAALWVLAIGIMFVLGRLPLKTYIASELILGTPLLIAALPWGLLMFSEAPGEGLLSFFPALLVFVFTLVPMVWAIYLAIYGKSDNG